MEDRNLSNLFQIIFFSFVKIKLAKDYFVFDFSESLEIHLNYGFLKRQKDQNIPFERNRKKKLELQTKIIVQINTLTSYSLYKEN